MQDILKHTLYVGLNDKNTLKQELTTQHCENVVISVLKTFYDGFTLNFCKGYYKNNEGEFTLENTFKIEVLFASDEKTKKVIDSLKVLLNQESIALQVEKITSDLI